MEASLVRRPARRMRFNAASMLHQCCINAAAAASHSRHPRGGAVLRPVCGRPKAEVLRAIAGEQSTIVAWAMCRWPTQCVAAREERGSVLPPHELNCNREGHRPGCWLVMISVVLVLPEKTSLPNASHLEPADPDESCSGTQCLMALSSGGWECIAFVMAIALPPPRAGAQRLCPPSSPAFSLRLSVSLSFSSCPLPALPGNPRAACRPKRSQRRTAATMTPAVHLCSALLSITAEGGLTICGRSSARKSLTTSRYGSTYGQAMSSPLSGLPVRDENRARGYTDSALQNASTQERFWCRYVEDGRGHDGRVLGVVVSD